ncbi:MAG: PAS domain S-box protein [Syntrophomonadaceae bacterium]|nr:PAS domain S-box protein [Syntrophomonadaceae bacterium]
MKVISSTKIHSDEFLAALFSSSPIGLYIVQKGLFVSVNEQFQKLTGYSESELIGRPSFELILPDDRDLVRKSSINMLNGVLSHPYEYRIIQHNGEVKWILETVTSIEYLGNRAVLGNFMDISMRKTIESALIESQDLYMDLFENANDVIFILDLYGNFVSLNKVAQSVFKYSLADLANINVRELVAPDYLYLIEAILTNITDESSSINYELDTVAKDGTHVPLELRVRQLSKNGRAYALQGIARDITERKLMEDQLRSTNRHLLDIIEFLPDATFVIDKNKQVIAWNRAIVEMTQVPPHQILGEKDYAYSIPFYGYPRPMLSDCLTLPLNELETRYPFIKKEGDSLYTEVTAPKLNGGKGAFIWAKASPLYDSNGNITGAVETIRDISDRKQFEEQLKYMSLHDTLTSLYNRTYFEEEVNRLEVSRHKLIGLIICDVDGLKLVNDTLGHEAGDRLLIQVAKLLKSCFRADDVVSRIGGDEFAILVPGCNAKNLESAYSRIKAAVHRHNSSAPDVPISLSVGFAIRDNPELTMNEVFQIADNNMYREKLHSSQSARSAIVQTLMTTLKARDYITEKHTARLREIVALMAQHINLPEHRLTDLKLLAEFHDIGKVGIPDHILFKPGPLTIQETQEMRRHSEIGYRIALSAPELVPIADWILKHHEWWNGQGYPAGLKENEIPLECRILALADSYDAMTSDRPYRAAMSKQNALEEIRKFAGIQFDPLLAILFIELIEKNLEDE